MNSPYFIAKAMTHPTKIHGIHSSSVTIPASGFVKLRSPVMAPWMHGGFSVAILEDGLQVDLTYGKGTGRSPW